MICEGVEVLVLKKGTLPSGDTKRIPFNHKEQLQMDHFWQLMPRDKKLRRGVTILEWIIDSEDQVGLLHNAGGHKRVLTKVISLVPLCIPVQAFMRNRGKKNSVGVMAGKSTLNRAQSSGREAWVISPGVPQQ